MKWTHWFAGALGAAAAACLALSMVAMAQPAPRPAAGDVPATSSTAPAGPAQGGTQAGMQDDPVLRRGKYLVQAGDCISCHTRAGGAPFAGGLPMKTPFGTIVSTNITPDAQHGIGSYTEEDFVRALREGKAKDGHHLYPAMPYPSFARVSDEDMHALYTYMRHGVAPSAQVNPETDLPWPFSMRWLMVGWNLLYLDNKRFQPRPSQSAEWNRGAYLVTGLGHCGDCHTPRSVTGGVKAADERGGRAFLSGGDAEGWHAQGLRPGDAAIGNAAAVWSVGDLVAYLRTGRNAHTATFGPMSQVVENSTQYLSQDDLVAMATYLRGLASADGATATAYVAPTRMPAPGTQATGVAFNALPGPAMPQGAASAPQPAASAAALAAPAAPVAAPVAAPSGAARLLQGADALQQRGAMVYLNNCNACHRSDGTGAQGVFPALAGNSVVNARNPASVIRMVLGGSAMPSTQHAPAALAMPGFAWRLSDADVAELLTFVRSSWGNQAAAVDAKTVAAVRKDMGTQAAK